MVAFSMGVVANVPLGEVDIGLLADEVGVTATDTLDLGQRVHDLLLAVNIGVEQTQDELEVRLLAGHERCYREFWLADIQFRVSSCATDSFSFCWANSWFCSK
jgi:hypothetical protein